jgi:hypothetical protein
MHGLIVCEARVPLDLELGALATIGDGRSSLLQQAVPCRVLD